MSFAEGYLQKHAIGDAFIRESPDPELKTIIAIPAYNESGLTKSLDSLFKCDASPEKSEVIVLINQGEHTDKEIIDTNLRSYQSAQKWIASHQRDDIRFHVVFADKLPKKHFGAGLARKLVMDEAVRRFNSISSPGGIILSLDADCLVEANYISAVRAHFNDHPNASGCSIQFKHLLEGDEFSEEVYASIRNYELHLHYYLQALRSTGYPYAFHTIGSCFAVKAEIYCRQGGMSKRKAGEDFYFIQKVAMQGQYTECKSTTVFPSPRPSDRVPFGTGPEISKQLKNPGLPYLTFAPELFEHLRLFYSVAKELFSETDVTAFLKILSPHLRSFLEENNFREELKEIRECSFIRRILPTIFEEI